MNLEQIKTMLKIFLVRFIILQLLLVFISVSYAGELNDFEKDAILKRSPNTSGPDKANQASECGIIWILLSACGDKSDQKESTENLTGFEQTNSDFSKNSSYFRLDVSYQNTKTDVSSINVDLQGVQNSFGFRTKLSRFSEVSPNDDLSYIQFHGLFKPQSTSHFNVAVGLGIGILRGEQVTSGLSLYVPAYYKLNNVFSIEVNGSVTRLNKNPIIDTRISISARYKHVALLISYLSLISPEENIHGPSLGISIQVGK